ncbi:conserved membrane protein of unknown function [Pseudomonas marincola]|uniref:DUF2878 domain-containing protein n=1 Tax=Pseudomonas marincola TaxID=437900 RepID=A0A653E6Y3_9PSED|nr:DUF2878 domain-containing protein [Pseudomonas marincola]CAE6900523.1 conserved membrane protein of unknown function [Pseudomonas marincola]
MSKLLANALLFQLGWFTCILAGNSLWLLIVGAVLAIHLLWTSSWHAEGKLLISVFLAGSALDTFLLNLGLFQLPVESKVIPLWWALLWPLFASTLNHCLAWTAKPWWRASLLGALGGPLSYYAGVELAGIQMPHGEWPTLLLLAVIWAGVMPILHGFSSLYRSQYEQRLRTQR